MQDAELPAGRPRRPADVYTADEAAYLLGMNHKTIYKWMDSGRLKGWRIPFGTRNRRIRRIDLIEFIANGETPEASKEFFDAREAELRAGVRKRRTA